MIPLSDPDVTRRSRPYVNITLIALCILVFLYELSLGGLDRALFFYRFGLIPLELTQGIEFTTIDTGLEIKDISSTILAGDTVLTIPTWGTVFTAMFIHGDILHLGSNMLFLWVFGDNVEDRLGHVKYLLFYLATGVAATWTQVAINMQSDIPNIGASGAIAGVLGAYFILHPFSRVRTLVIFYFITFMRIPAVFLLGFWIALQFLYGVIGLGPISQGGGGVAYWAHIGGFAAGVLGIMLFKLLWREPLGPRRRPYDDWP